MASGTGDYDKIAEVIRKAFKGENTAICGVIMTELRMNGFRVILSTPSYTAYLKYLGCDNNCCVLFLWIEDILEQKNRDIVEEAENLAKNGVKGTCILIARILHVGKDLCGDIQRSILEKLTVTVDIIKWM